MPNLHLIEVESDPAANHKILITLLDGMSVSINASAADYSNLLTLLRYTIRLMTVSSTKATHIDGSIAEEFLTSVISKSGTSDEREKIRAAAKKILPHIKDVC